MSQHKKTLKLLRTRPMLKNIRYDEVECLLLYLGFYIEKNGGSHVKFRHDKLQGHISIPKKETIKAYTIEEICDKLDLLEVE